MHVVHHSHDALIVRRIFCVNMLQNLHLDDGLVVEALLVTDELDRYAPASLVVDAFDNLPETALSNHLENFVAKADVVADDKIIIAPLIVVPVIQKVARRALHLELLHVHIACRRRRR